MTKNLLGKAKLRLILLLVLSFVLILFARETKVYAAAGIPDGYIANWNFDNNLNSTNFYGGTYYNVEGYYNAGGDYFTTGNYSSTNKLVGSHSLSFEEDISYYTTTSFVRDVTSNRFTYSILFYLDPAYQENYQILAMPHTFIYFAYNEDATKRVGFYMGDGSSTVSAMTNSQVSTGAWHHVVGVWDGDLSQLSIYFDGDLQHTTPYTLDITDPSYLCNEFFLSYGGCYFRGYMDDSLFYNSVLSSDDILNLYNYYYAQAPTDVMIDGVYTDSIAENTASGTAVGTLTSTDVDTLSATAFTYSFDNSVTNDNAAFTINNTTDSLVLNTVPDYETKTSYTVNIITTDDTGLTFSKALTINVTNVNEAPTDITLAGGSVAENSAIGTEVGTLSGVDPEGNSLSFSLPNGVTDNASFTITGTSLKLNVVPDCETKNTYTVTVQASDGSLTYNEEATITITNVNEAPTGVGLTPASVSEHTATLVGTLSPVDPDTTDTFTYSLVSGTGDSDNSSFIITGDSLSLTATANYETKPSYAIRVQVKDSGNLTAVTALTVSVVDGNDPPSDIAIDSSAMNENQSIGTTVGTLSSVDNAGNTHSYTLVTGTGDTDNASFTITGSLLKLAVTANFETKNSYLARIRSTDNFGQYVEKAFTISINNVNEAPTDITLTGNSVAENSAVGTDIGSLSGVDPDASSTFTYSLPVGLVDNASFAIDGNVVELAIVPDYETDPSFSVTVRVSDGNLTYDETFAITITNTNDAPTAISLTASSVTEHGATLVATLSAIDQDGGGSHTFDLVTGIGSDDNNFFTIAGTSLSLKAQADYETQNTYSIRLRVSDPGTPNQTFIDTFVINVADGNDPPSDITIDVSTVNENQSVGTTVGTLSSADNVGDTHTYTLVTGTGDTDNASFTIAGSLLKMAVSANFETKSSYSVCIRSTDNFGQYVEKAFTISINNVNEAPTDITLTGNSVAENSAVGTDIGSLSGVDPDAGSSFTYSLPTGLADNASFAIDGNVVELAIVPDYETDPSFSVTVRVSDGTLTYDKTFAITMTDANDAPTDITLSKSDINENAAISSIVGSLSGVDQDGGVATFTLVSGDGDIDNSSFAISSSNLITQFVTDYESKASYSIRVRATDVSGLYFEKKFTILVNDSVFDAPTDISLSPTNIDENTTIGGKVGDLSATDLNGGIFTFAEDGSTTQDNELFSISGSAVYLEFTPDYEAGNSYIISVKVTDNTALTYVKNIPIIINDINESPTNITILPTNISENVAIDTIVAELSASDQDTSTGFTYTLVSGTGDTDNAMFSIDSGTNDLRLENPLDYELKPSLSIRVQVSDGNSTFTKVIPITVVDGNDVPTDIAISSVTINENSISGASVGTLSTTDSNGGTFTYTLVSGLGSDDNSGFTISGGQLQLAFVPNYETKNSYKVRIRTTDSGGLYYEEEFTIAIANVNEAPTGLTLSGNTVAENTAAGTDVGTLSATDPDTGSSYSYTLTSGSGDTNNASFSIVGNILKTNSSFNCELKSNYSVRIRVTDGDGLFYELPFAVTVTDVNEAPTDITISPVSISENTAANTVVTELSATDPESVTGFAFTLVSGAGDTDNALFSIDNGTNDLRLESSLDFETKTSLSIRVQVSDGTYTFDKPITITVDDGNDVPTDLSLTSVSIDENTTSGNVVGTLSTTDPNGGPFTYTLVSGLGSDDNSGFTISSGQLQLAFVPNYEVKNSYKVRIRTTDNGGLYYEEVATITIINVNEAPTDLALSNHMITENASVGAEIGTLSGTDPDAGSIFTYTLVAGTGDTDNASFSISGNSVRTTSSFNYEVKSSYSIRLRVADVGGLNYEKSFVITVTNVNEAPTNIVLTGDSIAENTVVGTTVGSFTADDVDAGSSFTYSLVSGSGATDNASFTIAGSNLKLAIVPNYEAKTSYNIRVSVSDGALTYEEQFIITITNVNDAPANAVLSHYLVAENTPLSTTIATVSASDEDAGESLEYELVTGDGSTDNISFILVGNELKLAASPNYEAKNSYSIRIKVTDGGGLSSIKGFLITVTNVNEAPTDLSLSKTFISENLAIGTEIGTVSTTDADQGDTFYYTLAGGNGDTDNHRFTLNGNTLKLGFVPDYETNHSYSIRIRTTDAGWLYFDKVFTITITDVNEDTTVYYQPSPNPSPKPSETPKPSVTPVPTKDAITPTHTPVISPTPTPAPVTETITMDVTNGKDDTSITELQIQRTTQSDGKVSDSIVYRESDTRETVDRLQEDNEDTARIIVPETNSPVAEVNVNIPVKSLDLLSKSSINLEMETNDVRISIPNDSLKTATKELEDDLYFNIVPIEQDKLQDEVIERVKNDSMVIELMQGEGLTVVGKPMEIKTNMPSSTVDIVLPLEGIIIPSDAKERDAFLETLAVYVEHSDGEKEVIKGEIVEYKPGVFGIKFSVSKFSTFTIIAEEALVNRADECKLLKLGGEAVKGTKFSAVFEYGMTSLELKANVSEGATWKLYSDAGCKKLIKNNKLKLKVGKNKVYIKVTSKDKKHTKTYAITLMRSAKQ